MPDILKRVDSPQDLKKLSLAEMNDLAQDIRQLLISSVAQCGGHLAANLGVVELTIALHYVFNTPQDKIIWDVGHQSYVHKILTGRKDSMSTLRQYGGMSGFPKSEESAHDAFDTGHSSTSISAAVGMALARDIKDQDYSVVAVMGDGALTGGMAYEALNHAGNEGTDITVILNDNEMSISKNVGAMSSYLNRLRTDPSYSRTKEEIESVLSKIPGIGPNIAKAAGRFKDSVKHLMVPGVWFEELGFTYIGPVNGHDLEQLTIVLNNVRTMKGPVLVHVITQKGRGYQPALNDPDLFHGIGPFDINTGKQPKKPLPSYTEIFGDYILDKAQEDSAVVAITAAMTSGTGLKRFARAYPERFFDVGICEQHAVTMAAGMAKAGLKPVVCIYSTFLQRAYDQILHDVALQNLPVIFAIDRAGLVGEDGPTHHGVFDLAYLRNIPNFTILAPGDENEFLDMLETAFTIKGPVAIRYPRGIGEGAKIHNERQILKIGKAQLINEGQDLAVLAVGRALGIAREFVNVMAGMGIQVELVNARFIKPLDQEMIISLSQRFKRLITIEDNCLEGGFGSAVLEVLADHKMECEVVRLGIPDEFIEQGRVDILFDYLDLTPEAIAETVFNNWPDLIPSQAWGLRKIGES
ncbi:Deoxyxylulose-5-phosphate synthase [Syntrophomonas zehnderi OL-4]|uniref:1-deoxy-D-xylulose-5-phosphate synthase n=1 Tax=Syntrophomonas zehnderi OL-4 TaxID=690567 RepID=A0A0E4C8K2_9FIRM|nr:1-deoxy-D-xylulose-5-phosphate synthase [Syntrophomonas zehnderi]CFX49901.1 Deoxyxylulose-5-phosphate synthase [Syntrophomonas zehnderi OL-4]